MLNRSSFMYRVAIRQEDGSYKRFEVSTIAFRSDKIIVEYSYAVDANHGKVGSVVVDGRTAILEQYTGILDNTGARIYEHDILQDTRDGRKYKVSWTGCTAGFDMTLLDGEERYNPKSLYFANNNFGWFKIIGNIFDGNKHSTHYAMHVLTDTEKAYFNDRGWTVCDFKRNSTTLVKQIGSMSVAYIELRLEADPHRFVGNIRLISEQKPTAHGMFTTTTDITSVVGDTLIECCDKLMDALYGILSCEKENYINYVDNLIATCRKEK